MRGWMFDISPLEDFAEICQLGKNDVGLFFASRATICPRWLRIIASLLETAGYVVWVALAGLGWLGLAGFHGLSGIPGDVELDRFEACPLKANGGQTLLISRAKD